MKFKTGISSKLGYVDRLRSFLTLDNIVLYSFAFLKRLEAFLIDSAEMYKDIVAFSIGDESEAFLVVKPFNSSFAHAGTSKCVKIINCAQIPEQFLRINAIDLT